MSGPDSFCLTGEDISSYLLDVTDMQFLQKPPSLFIVISKILSNELLRVTAAPDSQLGHRKQHLSPFHRAMVTGNMLFTDRKSLWRRKSHAFFISASSQFWLRADSLSTNGSSGILGTGSRLMAYVCCSAQPFTHIPPFAWVLLEMVSGA